MLWLGSSTFFTFGVVLVLLGATQAEVARALSLDLAASGFLGAVLALGIGGGVLIGGPLVDRFARAPLMAGSCVVCALGLFVIGPQRSYFEVVTALIVLGIGCGVYDTLVNAVVLERAGARGASALALVHASATLGASVGPLLVRFGLNHWNWWVVFNAVGAVHLGLALAAVSLRGSRPSAARAHREGREREFGAGAREHSHVDVGREGSRVDGSPDGPRINVSREGPHAATSGRSREPEVPEPKVPEPEVPDSHHRWTGDPSRERAGARDAGFAGPRDARLGGLLVTAPALIAIAIAICAYVGLENGVTVYAVPWAASLGDSEPMGQWSISAFWGGLLIGRLWLVVLGARREASTLAARAETAAVAPLAGANVLDAHRDRGLQLLAACGIGGAVVVCAGALLAHGPLILATTLAGIALGPVYPLAMTLVARRAPNAAGTALGLVASAGAVGGFAIPWVAGAVGDRFGVQASVTLLGLHGFVVAAAAIALERHEASKQVPLGNAAE